MRPRALLLVVFAYPLAAAEIRFSGDELAGLIQHSFSGVRVRLHQDADVPGELSYIDLGPNFKGQRFSFAVPPKDISLGVAGKARYVLNDIQSAPKVVPDLERPVRATARNGAFELELRFEDDGTELKGVPLGRMRRVRGGAIPDVEISDIRIIITLIPSKSEEADEIRFEPSQVAFLGTTQAGGLGNLPIFGRRVDLLNPLTDYKRVIRNAIEREVKKLIDRNLPRLAGQITAEIRKRGEALGMRIDRVRFENTDLVISGAVQLR